MRRRTLSIVLVTAAVAVAVVAVPYLLRQRDQAWTTQSPEALAAFGDGLEARMRFYLVDAAGSFRKALTFDPGFVAAKVQLLEVVHDDTEHKKLRSELESVDASRLNERERFLLELALANREQQLAITSRYLASHPKEPRTLFVAAGQAWDREDWTEAAELYSRLLQVAPNWVLARNNLGYLAMAQARFAEAEEQFRTYAYVAPDQANPHDSLGELLSLLGRYDEARSEFERALVIRPDFCASYEHLVGIAIFEGKPEEITPIVERAAEHCPPEMASSLECGRRFLAAFIDKDFDAPWRDGFASCGGKVGSRGALFHRLALLAGRLGEATAEETALDQALVESRKTGYGKTKARMVEVAALHVKGVHKLIDGEPQAAAELFRAADARASYWGVNEGRLKLFNMLNLALALERAGDEQDSAATLARVKSVNPPFAAIYAVLAERTPAPR